MCVRLLKANVPLCLRLSCISGAIPPLLPLHARHLTEMNVSPTNVFFSPIEMQLAVSANKAAKTSFAASDGLINPVLDYLIFFCPRMPQIYFHVALLPVLVRAGNDRLTTRPNHVDDLHMRIYCR